VNDRRGPRSDGDAVAAMSVGDILAFYTQRGYVHQIGMGQRPAIIVIDFSCAFTQAGDFPGGNFEAELRHTRRVLDAARGRFPIIYTTIAYEPHLRDAGFWKVKVPWLAHCKLGSQAVEIDATLGATADEAVIVKKFPSAFHGTDLDARLKRDGIDTLIIAGCTTSVCVRATALDAMQHGYRALVAREAVGDFNAAVHAVHLTDIGARYADVVSVADLLKDLAARTGKADRGDA
jgi:maleamate amidohydrolase